MRKEVYHNSGAARPKQNGIIIAEAWLWSVTLRGMPVSDGAARVLHALARHFNTSTLKADPGPGEKRLAIITHRTARSVRRAIRELLKHPEAPFAQHLRGQHQTPVYAWTDMALDAATMTQGEVNRLVQAHAREDNPVPSASATPVPPEASREDNPDRDNVSGGTNRVCQGGQKCPPNSVREPCNNGELCTKAATPLVLTSPLMAMTVTSNTSITATTTTWLGDACGDWLEIIEGIPNRGRIGSALKPLVEQLGWETPLHPPHPCVREAWRKYLREKDPAFANPQDFASKFGAYWKYGAGKLSLSDHNRRVTDEWGRKMDARERGEVHDDDGFFWWLSGKPVPAVREEED